MTVTKVYCDRCGREIDNESASKRNVLRILDWSVGDTYEQYDICKNCMVRLKDFMSKSVASYSDITDD